MNPCNDWRLAQTLPDLSILAFWKGPWGQGELIFYLFSCCLLTVPHSKEKKDILVTKNSCSTESSRGLVDLRKQDK